MKERKSLRGSARFTVVLGPASSGLSSPQIGWRYEASQRAEAILCGGIGVMHQLRTLSVCPVPSIAS
ncbi:MAG: hypothetical protein R3B07_31880 [Polyangiaceae bacterium]